MLCKAKQNFIKKQSFCLIFFIKMLNNNLISDLYSFYFQA